MKHIDKNSLKHFCVCFMLSFFGPFGVCAAIGASICKEWYDRESYGHWCWWDILFDALGILCGLAVWYAIEITIVNRYGFSPVRYNIHLALDN